MEKQIIQLAETLWEYQNLKQKPRSADILIVMGHNDLGIARCAAALAKSYHYSHIVTTGGVFHQKSSCGIDVNNLEALFLKHEMTILGIPPQNITIEDRAKNTGENITYTKHLMASEHITTGQLVHTPGMQRRAYATAMKQWPNIEWSVTAEQITLDQYLEQRTNPTNVIHALVGDCYRMLLYPKFNFQIHQPMPKHVCTALRKLIMLGYTKTIPSPQLNLGLIPTQGLV